MKIDLAPRRRRGRAPFGTLGADPLRGVPRRESTLARLRTVIARVPRGRVATYGQIAERAGLVRGARVTVWALRSAPNLPWHRIEGAGGLISLPGEDGREQRRRLRSEGVTFRADHVRMERHEWGRGRRTKEARTTGGPRPAPTRTLRPRR